MRPGGGEIKIEKKKNKDVYQDIAATVVIRLAKGEKKESTMTTDTGAIDQARAELESIRDLVSALNNSDNSDEARTEIEESILEIQVRSEWSSVGEPLTASEYYILLCTGGPAVRIVGELDRWQEPETARLEYQDWFIPWTEYPIDDTDNALLDFAKVFYFGS